MNKLKNLGPNQGLKETQLGAIKGMGVENFIPSTEELILEGDYFEFIRSLSNKELKDIIKRIDVLLTSVKIKMVPKRNKVVKRFITISKEEKKELQAKKRSIIALLNKRNSNPKPRKYKSIRIDNFEVKYEVPTKLSMINQEIDYEIVKGERMMNENKIKYIEGVDEDGNSFLRKEKECVIPYSREGKLKAKDFLILHRCGRLGIKIPSEEKIVSTLAFLRTLHLPEDEVSLQDLFKRMLDSKVEFFVVLPKGGRKQKKYEEMPMRWNKYHKRHNRMVPVDLIIRKIYKPEIDGRNPLAKDIISEYRGSTEGYSPIYTYDKEEHMRDYVPNLLSYNQVEYGEKVIVVLGTEGRIKYIDGRIKSANKMKNDFHKFTNERIIPYKGQESRCNNSRIISDENGVQVFGLNLKGMPEENLKGYLRGFDRIPYQRNEEEIKEILETAQEMDGRQSRTNIEHDLRNRLKHLRTRSSKELYYLELQIEEEVSIPSQGVTFLSEIPGYKEEIGEEVYRTNLRKLHKPSKKEQALINVLKSFKSIKEVEEEEGKGLTNDIEDLVRIENNANDSNYKKSKNLFSQQMGILLRNQNPLRMEGGFSLLKKWEIKGGPISFPRNETIPRRNIEFVQRNKTKRVEIPQRTMFIRGFNYSIKTEKVKEDGQIQSKEIGINIESEPLFHSSFKEFNLERFLNNPVRIKEKPKVTSGLRLLIVKQFLEVIKKCEAASKEYEKEYWENYWVEYASKNMKIPTLEPREYIEFETNFRVKLPKRLTKETLLKRRVRSSRWSRFVKNNWKIPTARLFDDKNNPETIWKRVDYNQFLASEQKAYQFSGKIVFDENKHEFVRIPNNPHNKPSPVKVLHTIGNGKGGVDYYIISIDGKTLYAKGDISLLNYWKHETISFTGTRNPSQGTRKFVDETINMFLNEDDYVTVSGGAEGCDSIVHSKTINKGAKTIIVLAGGFNGQYTKRNQIKPEMVVKHGGLLLSEHPPEYIPSKDDFIKRNKVIGSLSDRLVVFEAGSGTMHCAKFGQELKKELLVQPGFKNNQTLIKAGIGRKFIPIEGFYPF